MLRGMHILLLNDDTLPSAHGGAAVVVDRLRRAYAAAGHRVTFITSHQREDKHIDAMRDDAGDTIALPIRYDLHQRHHLCVSNSQAEALVRATLLELKPEAVHAHNIHTYLTYESLLLARNYTNHIVLTAHDTFLVSFGRVSENRTLTVFDHLAASGRKYSPVRNGKIRKMLRASGTKVVAISNALKSFLENNNVPVKAMIYNGIEVPQAPSAEAVNAFRTKHNLGDHVIFFGGRVSGDKGIGVLLDAFHRLRQELPTAQLMIAGDPERVSKYVQSGHDIVLLGNLHQADMPLAYAASTVVTTPSIYLDPFNLINIEAMAAGKPVVGTSFGGTPEIVVHDKTGLIVDPRNTERFAETLAQILKNPARAQQMGAAGKERVLTQFSVQKQAQAYLELLSPGSTPLRL